MSLTCIYLCLLDYRFFDGRLLVLFIIPSHITYSISQHIFIVPFAWGGVSSVQFSCSVMSDILTPWTAACQASLTITNFHSLLKLMSIKSVMPSNHLILCHPLLLLSSIFPSIRVFSSEWASSYQVAKVLELQLQHQSFSEYSGLISVRMDWLDLLAVLGTLKSLLQSTVQKHQFFGTQLSLMASPTQ